MPRSFPAAPDDDSAQADSAHPRYRDRRYPTMRRAANRVRTVVDGYLERAKNGRGNRYRIDRNGHLQHPIFEEPKIGPLLDVLDTAGN
jgi:hypothetical protein